MEYQLIFNSMESVGQYFISVLNYCSGLVPQKSIWREKRGAPPELEIAIKLICLWIWVHFFSSIFLFIQRNLFTTETHAEPRDPIGFCDVSPGARWGCECLAFWWVF